MERGDAFATSLLSTSLQGRSMLGITDLKVGTFFELDHAPHQVLTAKHSKTGRAGAVLRTKMRNLLTSAVYERTFQGSESFPEADVTRRKGQFLYADGSGATFMDGGNFEQYTLSNDRLGSAREFLKEGTELDLVLYNEQVLAVQLPAKVELAVTYTEPGYKGDTQSSA